MQVSTGKLQALTIAAILVLISGGIAAYAQGQSTSTSSTSSGAPVALTASDTNSTTTTSTTSANTTLCQSNTTPKEGRIVLPITAVGASASASTGAVSFSNGRGCLASITAVGGVFNVQVALRDVKPVTQYEVVLVANGTSYTLGNMVTSQSGAGQIDNQVLLTTGTYTVSIQIYDTSSNPGQSTLVLQTGQGTITSPPFSTSNSGQTQSQFGQGGQFGQPNQPGQPGQHR